MDDLPCSGHVAGCVRRAICLVRTYNDKDLSNAGWRFRMKAGQSSVVWGANAATIDAPGKNGARRRLPGGTVETATEETVPAAMPTASLFTLVRSRRKPMFARKISSATRFGFGGHVKPSMP
jgi:hypothetical protein